jgi:alginate O-acetyltransferase complex protein AlgI
MITFMISGLWHGANWTFIIWGFLHGLYLVLALVLERPRTALANAMGLSAAPRVQHVLNVLVTGVLVTLAWVFFRAENVQQAFTVLKGMLLFDGRWGLSALSVKGGLIAPMLGLLASGLLVLSYRLPYDLQLRWPRAFIVCTTLTIILLGSNGGDFIYFQF